MISCLVVGILAMANPHHAIDNELRTYLQHIKELLDKNEFEDEEGKTQTKSKSSQVEFVNKIIL